MRTLTITLLGVVALALSGCEKTIHEARRATPSMIEPTPAIVPAVDGVPIG